MPIVNTISGVTNTVMLTLISNIIVDNSSAPTEWILDSGYWDDTGRWDDTAFWNDGI